MSVAAKEVNNPLLEWIRLRPVCCSKKQPVTEENKRNFEILSTLTGLPHKLKDTK